MGLPSARLRVEGAYRVAQRTPQSGRASELSRELTEHVLLRPDVAAGPLNLVSEDLAEREVLEERNDIGKGLVERQHVRVRRSIEATVHAVEQGMRGLVGDDVVRQAGEDHAPRHMTSGIVVRGLKVPEEQRFLCRAVVGVRLTQRVRVDAEALHVVGIVQRIVRVGARARGPDGLASEGPLEVLDGQPGDGVDHLLVELGCPFGWREPGLREEVMVVEIDRFVEALPRRVDVDDFEVFADRPGCEILPRHSEDDLADRRGVELLREARVERVSAQLPVEWGRREPRRAVAHAYTSGSGRES